MKPKKVRRRYTDSHCLDVMELLNLCSIRKVEKLTGIPKSTILDMKKRAERGEVYQQNKTRQIPNKKGGDRPLSYPPELDDELSAWILTLRENHVAVSPMSIKEKAKELITPISPSYVASNPWLRGFMRRHNWSLRARTSLSQKHPAQLEQKFTNFFIEVEKAKTLGRYPLALIGNMDETPMYFDLVPSRTIERMGEKEVLVRTTGADKRHLTVVLTVTADGKMPPPMIIFEGKRSIAQQVNPPPGIVMEVQEKGWMNQELVHVYIERIWRPFMEEVAEDMEMRKGSLLILDSFSAHKTPKIQETFQQADTNCVIVPSGCTPKVQPLDVSVNKPFKNILRACWVRYIRQQVEKMHYKIQRQKSRRHLSLTLLIG